MSEPQTVAERLLVSHTSDDGISVVLSLLKQLEDDYLRDVEDRLALEDVAEIADSARTVIHFLLDERRHRTAPYDYDNAPTDPRHGGKLTAEMASARLAELEEENTKLRAMLAKSNADCPYCGLPAADIAR